uniref:Uncharacterized protein n=1 Tax=Arundo donax TaxID=35708 RepID=A0A0A9ECL7_ARUDO
MGELGLELRPVRVQGGGSGCFRLWLPPPLRVAVRDGVCGCRRRCGSRPRSRHG